MLARKSHPTLCHLVILAAWALFSTSTARADMSIVEMPSGRLQVFIEAQPFQLSRTALLEWVERSAKVVSDYYDGFPVAQAYVAIRGRAGRGVLHGQAFGEGHAVVNVDVGLETTKGDLARDWILIHELIHLAFPSVPNRHTWIEEGLSVYVESIARVQSGQLTPEYVWRGFLRGIPKGLPQQGDRGLDHTPTWGRTYWGGALYCLLADIEIRKRTGNEKNLGDGLRAIVESGYNITRHTQLMPVLEVADRALGVKVMTELYKKMRADPYPVDLAGLWRQLGLRRNGLEVGFVDDAPLAWVRVGITSRD